MPAGMEGFKVTERVLNEWKKEKGIEGPVLGHASPTAEQILKEES